ncbi:transcriptional regulator [Brevibacillus reuszeri]|uniref:Response regulator n=1 Tax=Brevibacillus reuszeri TaxID=54915 RepID=A0A0K9YZ03_9BACL|nr:fused response regulator/phosphatase [Brevibacillus reuszeri]KNB73480.1 response regulator [Brevibacillus reuszeri]MED1858732.1 fused response regulator/phosphatase [Brevibacillus reuszeri]GED69712.1 transcriptional regulator [Brevibacillus reuszeri]
MNIVIVDDNETNLVIIEKILRKAGYQDLVLLSSAKELYQFLGMDSHTAGEVPVDLILLDLMMPEIDGVEACRTILNQERLRDLPIIFVTAMGDSYKMAEALDAGALDYVMKPINKVELLARIRSTLRLKREKDLRKERDKRIQNELALAKQVQRSMLSSPIHDQAIDISAVYEPSSELAGDLYAWYQIAPNRYAVLLLDMMGHGISSSLVCMYMYAALKDTMMGVSEPKAVMKELNRRMNQLQMTDRLMNYYFTAIYLVLDTEQRTIQYVNAGHPAGVAVVDGKAVSLDKGCCALGFFEKIEIDQVEISYDKESRIILFTDGLVESLEGRYENGAVPFMSRLREQDVHDPIGFVQKLEQGTGDAEPKDDRCLVMISTK